MPNNTNIKPPIVEKTHKNKKKTILKVVLLVLFFAATIYCVYAVSKVLSGGSIASLEDVFSHIDVKYLMLLIFVVMGMFLSDALKYSIIVKIMKRRFDYTTCMSVGIMGRFYDNITPLSTGGQAYQVYQLYKKGYSASEAAAVPIVKYVFQLSAWIVISLLLYIFNYQALQYLPNEQAVFIQIAAYVGVFFAGFALVFAVLFSIFPKTTHKIIDFFVRFLHKIKLIKNYEKVDAKIMNFLLQYKEALVLIGKNIFGVILLVILCLLDFILVMSVPYFVLLAIGGVVPSSHMFLDVITLNAYSLFAASLVPTPGNSGAIEAAYSMVFAPIPMKEGTLFWVVFIWRFCTYYIYLLLGFAGMFIVFARSVFMKRKYGKFGIVSEYRRKPILLAVSNGEPEDAEDFCQSSDGNDLIVADVVNENDKDCSVPVDDCIKQKDDIKILEVIDNYFPVIDGVVNVVDNYTRLLNKKADCEVLVPWYPKSRDGGGYKVVRSMSISGGKYGVRLPVPMFDVRLKRYLKEQHYDIIHLHSPVTLAKFILPYAKKHNIPVVFTLHTRFHEEINRSVKVKCLQRFALNFLLSTIRKTDNIWAVSNGIAQCLIEDYKIDKPCDVVRHGTDLVPFEVEKSAALRDGRRNELNIEPDETVLLFVGRLVVVKNVSLTLKTVAELKARGVKCRFIVVGDGDYKRKLIEESVSLDIENEVDFVGRVENREELSSYYLAADYFMFPSTFDSFGLVTKEAAAMDLPSVVVKGASAAEEIVDGYNGFIAEERVEAWADKIEYINLHPEIYKTAKDNCRATLYRSWDSVVDEVYDKYLDVIKANKKDKENLNDNKIE